MGLLVFRERSVKSLKKFALLLLAKHREFQESHQRQFPFSLWPLKNTRKNLAEIVFCKSYPRRVDSEIFTTHSGIS